MLYFKSVSILMHDVFNKKTPCDISNLFNCSNELHNYNTRFSLAANYYKKYSRCNHLLKSFSRLGAKIWNSIPQELRKVPKFVFKANLQNRLLEVLMEEDDYVGIPFLIKKFQNNCSKKLHLTTTAVLSNYLFIYLIFILHVYFFFLFTYPILTIIIYFTL